MLMEVLSMIQQLDKNYFPHNIIIVHSSGTAQKFFFFFPDELS